MLTNKGTPKTLTEAIENALHVANKESAYSLATAHDFDFVKKEVARHIRDYVANKIAPTMFKGTKEDIEAVQKFMEFFEK